MKWRIPMAISSKRLTSSLLWFMLRHSYTTRKYKISFVVIHIGFFVSWSKIECCVLAIDTNMYANFSLIVWKCNPLINATFAFYTYCFHKIFQLPIKFKTWAISIFEQNMSIIIGINVTLKCANKESIIRHILIIWI